MESLDILMLGVEAAIALAGFAGIIATFQFAGAKETRRAEAVGLTMILQFSLLAALMCSIPLLLNSFGIVQTTLWAISSLITASVYIGAMYNQFRSGRRAIRTLSGLRFIIVLILPGLCITVINFMNALNIFFHREPGPVIAGILWGLCVASFMFSRLLLRPVWRSVRIQEEAAELGNRSSG